MKLFTIGDSISQGFMSAAAARTDLAYSTLLADAMNLKVGSSYRFPRWEKGGLPLNLEEVCRRLIKEHGSGIWAAEWMSALGIINRMIDDVEDHYERKGGAANVPYQDPESTNGGVIEYFHNIAVTGFDVADSWLVTPATCKARLGLDQDRDDPFPINAAFYRTALKVLNPSLKEKYDDCSQINWLEKHAANPHEGVENLILWLGANNALGTVVSLQIKQTLGDTDAPPHLRSHDEREEEGWNLWHPRDFEAEYRCLLDKVDAAMKKNQTHPDWKVFVGDIPLVTIAPLAKGVGRTYRIRRKNKLTGRYETGVYYDYYVYFPWDEEIVYQHNGLYLTLDEVLHIDGCIREYNSSIRKLVEEKNANYREPRYHMVNISQAFQDMALKRNDGQVKYKFPEYFDYKYPRVNTKYYHADPDGRLRQGGLTGLDGVHPSAIGQGLIAYEFLKVMSKFDVVPSTDLNWPAIFKSDTLYSDPIKMMQEVYEHNWLAERLLLLARAYRRGAIDPRILRTAGFVSRRLGQIL